MELLNVLVKKILRVVFIIIIMMKKKKKYICTENLKCPKEYYLLIKEKFECISDCEKDDKYNYEFQDECYEYCPLGIKQ